MKERIEMLEAQNKTITDKQNEMQNILVELKTVLKNIEGTLAYALDGRETTIKHSEKIYQLVLDNTKKDEKIEKIEKEISAINIKMATWGGAITIIASVISYLLSK